MTIKLWRSEFLSFQQRHTRLSFTVSITFVLLADLVSYKFYEFAILTVLSIVASHFYLICIEQRFNERMQCPITKDNRKAVITNHEYHGWVDDCELAAVQKEVFFNETDWQLKIVVKGVSVVLRNMLFLPCLVFWWVVLLYFFVPADFAELQRNFAELSNSAEMRLNIADVIIAVLALSALANVFWALQSGWLWKNPFTEICNARLVEIAHRNLGASRGQAAEADALAADAFCELQISSI